MMTLEQYIKELLFEYECVTIPNFGAFLTRSYDFIINKETGEFTPSRKELTFNSLLTSNDGVLANYFALKQKISYEKALRIIEKETSVWKKKLKTQCLFIGELGKISLNENKKIQFEPYGKINFDGSAFGLSSFSRVPLTVTNHAKINLPFTKKEEFDFSVDIKKNFFNKKYLRYAAVLLISLLISSSSYYLIEKYINNQIIINQQIAQNKIKKNIQSATFNLGNLNSVMVSVDVVKNETNISTTMYSVIAGTFRNKSYANRKIKSLKQQGYNAAIAELNPKGMFRVAYGRFYSKDEAIKLLYHLKYKLNKDAWYLVEK